MAEAGKWRVIVIRRPLSTIQRIKRMGAEFDHMFKS